VLWLIFTFTGGVLSDTIGRRKVYVIGYVAQLLTIFPMFALVNSGDVWMLFIGISLFTIGLGFCYGPQAAWFSELFPASVRFSGVSISYALGAICGGAFAPLIAAWLVQETGGTFAVGVYLTLITLVAFAAVLMLRDRPGIDLGIDNQAEQEVGATVFDKRATPAGRRDQALVM
jgi:MFS family permease